MSKSYLTQYSYSAANFGDYHNPSQIVENNNLGMVRTTTRTYQHLATPYVVGLPSAEQVWVNGGATFSRSWTYDAASGFHTGSTTALLTTTYTPPTMPDRAIWPER